ncbi:hypothetical protein [Kitasatospora sp. NPDC085879]|uniref:hypothetical protein n=1 Tax=Kitasatospora sp. NPDC085879 TaxID=3154769 RepID=UPI000BB0DD9B|nr:hypothetical protein [Streptomyces sp. TLI_235]PBC70609.1 hypothetical protein BX265_5155 [Streptomyces sp. TLI_235]
MTARHHPHRALPDEPEARSHDRAALTALGALLDELAALGPGHGTPATVTGADLVDGPTDRGGPEPGDFGATA